jgi:hypothetical protein
MNFIGENYSLIQDINTYNGLGEPVVLNDTINGITNDYSYSYKVGCGKENNTLSLSHICK